MPRGRPKGSKNSKTVLEKSVASLLRKLRAHLKAYVSLAKAGNPGHAKKGRLVIDLATGRVVRRKARRKPRKARRLSKRGTRRNTKPTRESTTESAASV